MFLIEFVSKHSFPHMRNDVSGQGEGMLCKCKVGTHDLNVNTVTPFSLDKSGTGLNEPRALFHFICCFSPITKWLLLVMH